MKFGKIKAQNEAKRFAPRERNFNFELRAWATALSEFGALVLPLNSLNFNAFLEKSQI